MDCRTIRDRIRANPLVKDPEAWTRARPLFPKEQVQQDFHGWWAFAGVAGGAPLSGPRPAQHDTVIE